jgi:hypothetical protein
MMYNIGFNIGTNILLFIAYQITNYIKITILWNYIVDSLQYV